jgi:myo-inositol-1(or 4)-monophosphatase
VKYTAFITKMLERASVIALKNFGHVTSSIKPTDRNQVLTATDLAIGKLLVANIQQAYPDHNIIDEESGVVDRQSEYTWTIDPIDGTMNYAVGTPLYGIMIGLLKNNIPVAGGVCLPPFQAVYTAEKGYSAWRNNTKISVSKEERLENVLVAYGIDGHPENPSFTKNEIEITHRLVLNCRNIAPAIAFSMQ